MIDELRGYKGVGKKFASHGVVNHKRFEYVKGNKTINNVEGYFGSLKRGVRSTFLHK